MGEIEYFNRMEQKCLISKRQYETLVKLLSPYMWPDKHSVDGNIYSVNTKRLKVLRKLRAVKKLKTPVEASFHSTYQKSPNRKHARHHKVVKGGFNMYHRALLYLACMLAGFGLANIPDSAAFNEGIHNFFQVVGGVAVIVFAIALICLGVKSLITK